MHLAMHGRVQRGAAQWRAIRARYERSGAKQAEFCAQEEIALHSFKKHYRGRKAVASPLGAFVEV
jgi:hypothetical protein